MSERPRDIAETVARALAEDVGSGDVTAALIPAGTLAHAHVITREAAVICGQPWFNETFAQLAEDVQVEWQVRECEAVAADTRLCTLTGPARAILTGERSALNFLQTLSATATRTRELVEIVAGTQAQILDTRKTIPGLRQAQKYAVNCGGGRNHRFGLYDAILIKENHIMAAGSITAAIAAARALHPALTLEVETENLAEFDEALAAGPDIIMLDDYSLEDMREAVRRCQGKVKLEASGGVTRERLRAIAETGVDYISVGAITKDVKAIDLSMRFTV
ncbi:MAG: carboxylating nicotinate-nucleotide diphosphorylase [Gammaproteobacteria bacterium]|nr:carboxylating nicotinate-nucleotide diphosphorylase [Gammaproteobacteria bacterium]